MHWGRLMCTCGQFRLCDNVHINLLKRILYTVDGSRNRNKIRCFEGVSLHTYMVLNDHRFHIVWFWTVPLQDAPILWLLNPAFNLKLRLQAGHISSSMAGTACDGWVSWVPVNFFLELLPRVNLIGFMLFGWMSAWRCLVWLMNPALDLDV